MTLGDKIRQERDLRREIAEVVKEWAREYTDSIRDAIHDYIDGRLDAATQALATKASKTYVDTKIASLVANNNLNPPT